MHAAPVAKTVPPPISRASPRCLATPSAAAAMARLAFLTAAALPGRGTRAPCPQRTLLRARVPRAVLPAGRARVAEATAAPAATAPASSHVITVLSRSAAGDAAAAAGVAAAADVAAAVVEGAAGAVLRRRALGPAAVELATVLPVGLDLKAIRERLDEEGKRVGADINVQTGDLFFGGMKRLAVFDLDSTLIAQETIDELAAEAGREEECRAITVRAMEGGMNFRDALEQRVALLRGLHVDKLEVVMARVKFTPGAHRLISVLSTLGCETAVVSGGFHFLADHVRNELGLDHSFANRLEVGDGGFLTGRTVGAIVDAEFKASTLTRLAEARGLRPEEVLAVGDGSNDIPMISRAGLGVAFNAKPIVQSRAPARVNHTSLTSVLYLLGLSDEQIEAVAADIVPAVR